MAESPDPEPPAALALEVLTARRALPALTVTITRHTNGRAWLADTCCTRIWISAQLGPDQQSAALSDAVRVLRARLAGEVTWLPRQRCSEPRGVATG